MTPSVKNAPYRISPETLGSGDYFVGSRQGCMAFRKEQCRMINLHARLNDIEKKRRIRDLVGFIKAHPGNTFYFSAIGCGRGHVDKEIVEHLIKPLVWLGNVRLPSSFLIDLLKDRSYMSGHDPERRQALKNWHKDYCANGEKRRDPSFHKAAMSYGQALGGSIFGIVSEYQLNNSLFKDNAVFKDFMTRLRDTLEGIASVPLPECLEGTTENYQHIPLGGKSHLYRNGFNVLPNPKPKVTHNLRSDLKDWIAKDENKEIFEKLDHLTDLANYWSHYELGPRKYYDELPGEVMSDFKYFVTRFQEFVAEVRKNPSA